VITCDIGVAVSVYGDGLTGVVTMDRIIVMPNPKLISIGCVFDCGDIIIRAGFHALTGNINVA
jgi:hypothetical protein